MPHSWYFFCPLCEDWRPSEEHVNVKNGFKVQKPGERPHIAYAVCKPCLAEKLKSKAVKVQK